MNTRTLSTILRTEEEYFDHEAAELTDVDLRIADDQIERYRRARLLPSNTAKDTLFASLLPVAGKQIVDYGCGTGDLACELALCGAQVTAFDLSPESVAKARRRAELHGVNEQTTLDVRAAGDTGYPPASFDIATGVAILHHLHTELPRIFEEVARILRPTGVACFIEPVANSPVLRGLRSFVPVARHATPDERQLRYQDFAPLQRHFTSLEFHHFYCLGRLRRLLGGWGDRLLRRLDYCVQRLLPFMHRYYGIVLVIARR